MCEARIYDLYPVILYFLQSRMNSTVGSAAVSAALSANILIGGIYQPWLQVCCHLCHPENLPFRNAKKMVNYQQHRNLPFPIHLMS